MSPRLFKKNEKFIETTINDQEKGGIVMAKKCPTCLATDTFHIEEKEYFCGICNKYWTHIPKMKGGK